MKKILLLLALLPFLKSCLSQNTATTIKGNHALVTLPADYNKQSKQLYPVIIFFPGKYAFSKDTVQLSLHGPHKFIKDNIPFTFNINGKQEQPIIISVQIEVYVNPKQVDKIVDYITAHYPVDVKRVYAAGISAGCNCWLRYINYSQQYANKIAATVLVSPQPASDQVAEDGSKGYKPKFLANANTKCWILCGTSDSFWKGANLFASAMNKTKSDMAIVTPFKGFGHEGFWDVPFNPTWRSTTNHQSIYEWLLSNSK